MENKEQTSVPVEQTTQPTATTTETKTPTVEELQARIASLEAEKGKLKKAMDAACSDAAKFKKDAANWQDQFKSTLDEQKRKEFEAEEANKQILAQLAEYKNKERVSTYKAKLMTAGYDEATASAMSAVLPDGVEDGFFEAQRAFLENTKQSIKTQALNAQPNLSTGMPPTSTPDAQAQEEARYRRWMGLPTKK